MGAKGLGHSDLECMFSNFIASLQHNPYENHYSPQHALDFVDIELQVMVAPVSPTPFQSLLIYCYFTLMPSPPLRYGWAAVAGAMLEVMVN